METKIAVVTGANRGLGLATTRKLAQLGYTVILGARDSKKGSELAQKLKKENLSVYFESLDTSSSSSINNFTGNVLKEFQRVDILINNAGILIDDRDGALESALKTKISTIQETLATNTFGPFLLIQAFLPSMLEHNFGRIVNVSSGMGQLSEMNGGYSAYRLSKTALNAVTRIFADEAKGKNILVNSVCPGWVKTDMGGPGAARSLEQGIAGIVWAATLPDEGPRGGFFRDGEAISW